MDEHEFNKRSRHVMTNYLLTKLTQSNVFYVNFFLPIKIVFCVLGCIVAI